MITYTDPANVINVARDEKPPRARTATGYGGKIPTPYRIRYATGRGVRWLRVYAAVWGNAGSVYILTRGARLVLDIDTEQRVRGDV